MISQSKFPLAIDGLIPDFLCGSFFGVFVGIASQVILSSELGKKCFAFVLSHQKHVNIHFLFYSAKLTI